MTGYFCPKWSGRNYQEQFYSYGEVRQPCLYLKGSECVHAEIDDGNLHVLPCVKIMITS